MKDGFINTCKGCCKAARKPWSVNLEHNRKRSREYQRRWRPKNKERQKIYRQTYTSKNRPKILLAKKRRRISSYGLTIEQYEKMLASQGNRCASCGGEPDGRWKKLHIDHCHKTGKVRGLLCVGCNRAIGYLGDDPMKATFLAEYLLQHSNKRA